MSPRPAKNADVSRRDSDTREKIIKLAYSAFAKNGYARTSLQVIASELNITRPALYYHFQSKEDLFVAVYEHVEAEARADASPVLAAASPEDFKAELEKYFAGIVGGFHGDDERVRYVSTSEAAATELPALRECVRRNNQATHEEFRAIVQHGIDLGAVPASSKADDLAHYLQLVMYGMGDAMLRQAAPDWQAIWPFVTKVLFSA